MLFGGPSLENAETDVRDWGGREVAGELLPGN
jgi:hypothetical protein